MQRNMLVVYTIPRTEEQKSSLDTVKSLLKKYKVNYGIANRDKLSIAQFKNKDLIIAVGGDGTFLRAAQFANKQLLFGVNAEVKDKEGFFMKSDKASFEAKLRNILNNDFQIRKLPRLEAYINNKKIDALALNEFFIGPRKSYHAAKYVIETGGKQERQKSSGVLVTTPVGSYAWAKSCCNRSSCNNTLPLDSEDYQFVVREPYEGNVFKNYKLIYGVLNKSQKISILSEMLDGILIADSVGKEYGLKNGSKATIGLSDHFISVIWE